MKSEEVKDILNQLGSAPQKSKGQHFLLDETVCDRMVEVANVSAEDTIVEIGPGLGVLTKKLAETGAHVISVELDKNFVQYIESLFQFDENVTVLEGDILRLIKDTSIFGYIGEGSYKIVANLPYNITSHLLKSFLTAAHKPEKMVVMIQKEVAERITEEPGKMSLLSLSVQYYADPRLVMNIPADAFYPPPQVNSAILDIDIRKDNPSTEEEKELFRLAKMGFVGKRKQLKNTMMNGLHWDASKVEELLEKSNIKPQCRPQELSIDDWKRLAKECNLL